jgi:hypothetical protein
MDLPMNGYDWNHPSFLCGFVADKLMLRLKASKFGETMGHQGVELVGGAHVDEQ